MTIQSTAFKFVSPLVLLALPSALFAQAAQPPMPEASAATEAPPAPTATQTPPAPAASASEPIATAAPEPAAAQAPAATGQASYPPCSATVTDQCMQGAKRKVVKKMRRN